MCSWQPGLLLVRARRAPGFPIGHERSPIGKRRSIALSAYPRRHDATARWKALADGQEPDTKRKRRTSRLRIAKSISINGAKRGAGGARGRAGYRPDVARHQHAGHGRRAHPARRLREEQAPVKAIIVSAHGHMANLRTR